MTTVDLRPGSAVLALPDDSDADVTITAVDSAGDAVDLTGNAFTVDILSDGSVLLAATMDLTDIATGVIVAGFDDDDLSAITATGLRWRLRNTTAEKNWITGSCSVSSDGTASSASQSVSVVVDSSTLTVTLGAVGAGPAGPAGADGTDGNTVLYGSGAPDDGADGVDGNFYIDTDGPTLYGPKAAGAWPAGVSMVGPAGSGSGDVIGPASATDNAVVLFNGTTGKLIKDSTVVLGDSASKNVGTGSGDVAAGDAVATHSADTTSVHGITDTSALVVDGDPASSLVVGTLDGNLSAVSEGTVEDAIQAVDDLSLGGSVAIPISPSGQWMMAAGGVRPEEGIFIWYNGMDGGTSYIHYHAPFQPVSSYRITDVMVEITTALASNNVRVGLVVLGQDGQPDSLVSNIGTIDASSTGRKSISGLTIDLTAGVWYCFCSLNVGGGGSIAARCFYGGGMGVGSWGSSNDVLNRSKSDARVTLSGETYYASGFPDPPDDWTDLQDPPSNNYAGPREIWQVKIGATP